MKTLWLIVAAITAVNLCFWTFNHIHPYASFALALLFISAIIFYTKPNKPTQ